MKKGLLISVFLLVCISLVAQKTPAKICGADDYYQRQMASNPAFTENQKRIEKLTKEFIQKSRFKKGNSNLITTPIVTIPVVVHVLWNQPIEKISIQQIQSQIDVLNKDFQLLNADTVNTPEPFKPFRANCQVAFCLAKRDPNGYATNGIVYKQTQKSWFYEPIDDAMFSALDGDDIWDRDQYLNIWVVPALRRFDLQYIRGYAHFPGGSPETDGVVIQHNEFGVVEAGGTAYAHGRTATHEVGHWLNLKHIWGIAPIFDCLDSDYVDDTPNQDGPNYNCNTFPHYSCSGQPHGDMFMNYMDYSEDECLNMFTLGQKERMLAVFEPGGPRYALLSSQGCVGAPDLIIGNPGVSPGYVSPGNNVVLSFYVDNIGIESAGPSYVNFHLSADDLLTPGQNGDIYLGQYFVNQTINAQTQTILLSSQVTIPAAVEPGTYYVFFAADGTGVINEYDEYNNFATAMITVSGDCADLVIIEQSATPLSVTAGNTITVNFKEQNAGNANAGPNFVSFHLSANGVLTPGQNGDTYLDEYYVNQTLLPQTQTGVLSKQVTIPPNTNTGTYYLFFSADGTGVVNECDNLNNFATVILTITGIQSTQPGYKYWFDDNHSNPVAVSGSFGSNYLVQSNISTNTLQPGLHSFSIMFKDVNQKWSSVVSSAFYKLNINPPAGYSKYEYWFDNLITTPVIRNISGTSNLVMLDSINTNVLNPGLHSFNIRFKPDAKHWSSVISSVFYKPQQIAFPPAQYEYWFDDNYAGRLTSGVSSTSNLLLFNNLGTANLNTGLHSFHIRFKLDGRQWSAVESSSFYKILESATGAAKYQYWFDDRPQDSVTTVISNAADLILLDSLSNSLPVGLHTLSIRFKPEGRTWSSVVSKFFYKTQPTGIMNNSISQCVYWYDNNWQDPRIVYYGGQPDLSSLINTDAEELAPGMHRVSMMFKDERGVFSNVVSDSFNRVTITTPVCPVTDKQFINRVFLANSATRQWQQNTGSGFVNITDNSNYSGTGTDTLQITGAPTSWYGYTYRCILTDGAVSDTSNIFTLKFSLTWNGATDNSWENPANWNCGVLPDANTDVMIYPGAARFPEINTSVSCRSLTAKPGVSVTVKPGAHLMITH